MERRFQNLESRRIFVARLANGTKKPHLLRLFQPAGAIHAVVRRKPTGNVAFVTFSTIAQARDVVEAASKTPITLHKRRLAIAMADAWNTRDKLPPTPRSTNPNSTDGILRPKELPAEVVEKIASYLSYRDLAHMELVSKSWRAGVISNMRGTRELSLQSWRWPRDWTSANITKDCFVWAAKRCGPNLRSARLSDAEAAVDLRPQCLTLLASHAPGLRVLDLSGFKALPSGLRAITEGLKELTTLKLGLVEGPVDPELSWIFRATKLRHFSATSTAIKGAAFRELNPLIEELELADTAVRPSDLAEGITRCRNLVTLRLDRLREFDEGVLQSIANNESLANTLRHLKLVCCNPRPPQVDDEEMQVEQPPEADFIELPELPFGPSLLLASRLAQVTTLEIRHNGWVDNAFVIGMGRYMTNLHELSITGNTNIRGQFALDPLRQLIGLRHLEMSMLYPDVGAQFLRELRHLESLICQDNEGVTDEDVCGLLRNCHTIKDVDVEGCKNIGRRLIDCVMEVFRGNPRDADFILRVGGTGAVPYRRDRRMMHVRINYQRESRDPYA